MPHKRGLGSAALSGNDRHASYREILEKPCGNNSAPLLFHACTQQTKPAVLRRSLVLQGRSLPFLLNMLICELGLQLLSVLT